MSSGNETKPIEVAIIGGGIGGLCVAIGLLKYPHIRVQIYEAAHKFSEIGAGVAFGPNAQRALKLIGPEVEQAYLRHATHNVEEENQNTFFQYRLGMGPDAEKLIATARNETGQSSVHRAKFLEEFVSLVPPEIAHFGKRLDQVEEIEAGGVKLHFKDGSTVNADCVVGADGIHSIIRPYLIGADHPALNPVFTGSVAYRGLVPMNVAVEALGAKHAQNSEIWIGKDRFIMTYPIDGGETMNMVAMEGSFNHWDGDWVQPADYRKIEQAFSDWGTQAKKLIKLLDTPKTMAWSLWDHPPAPTYYSGKVAMMGDAAHASTPFQGQGAGQAIEDAFVLQSLFAQVDTPEKIPLAFRAYDKIRRPRSQQVTRTSREAGELCFLRLPGVEDNMEAFKTNMEWRMDWIWHRDVAGERDEALMIFNSLLAGKTID